MFVAVVLIVALQVAGACARHGAPAHHRVVIQGFGYTPSRLEVAAGDTIEWENRDVVPHSATARSGRWDSKSIAAGESWRVAARRRGDEPYRCVFHPSMAGTLLVR